MLKVTPATISLACRLQTGYYFHIQRNIPAVEE
jgi:hypothetical protein